MVPTYCPEDKSEQRWHGLAECPSCKELVKIADMTGDVCSECHLKFNEQSYDEAYQVLTSEQFAKKYKEKRLKEVKLEYEIEKLNTSIQAAHEQIKRAILAINALRRDENGRI